jgi:hypothetical protein
MPEPKELSLGLRIAGFHLILEERQAAERYFCVPPKQFQEQEGLIEYRDVPLL